MLAVSDHATSTETTKTMQDIKRNIFPFFDLPAELRNLIYNESLKEVTGNLTSNVKIVAKNTSSINLLLVSKQFNAEYKDQARKCKERVVALAKVDPRETLDLASCSLPSALLEATHIEVIQSMICTSQDTAGISDLIKHSKILPVFLGRLDPTQSVTFYWKLMTSEAFSQARGGKAWGSFNWKVMFGFLKRDLRQHGMGDRAFAVFICDEVLADDSGCEGSRMQRKLLKWSSVTDQIEDLTV